MKIAFISAFAPDIYNFGAPTAFVHQLLKYRPANSTLDVYYYEDERLHPGVESLSALNASSITALKKIEAKKPSPFNLYFKKNKREPILPDPVEYYSPTKSMLSRINSFTYDIVWLYPYWLASWIPRLMCPNILITGPDSASLHNKRTIQHGNWTSYDHLSPLIDEFKKNINLEKLISGYRCKVHFVGREDLKQYESVTGIRGQGVFIEYPLHSYNPISTVLSKRVEKKLEIVISGGANTVYVGNLLEELIVELTTRHSHLAKNFSFLFVGNGYEHHRFCLANSGFEVRLAPWLNNYEQVLSNSNIQIFPIVVGTGTKGKVIQALSTGLLGIGTSYSFENICIVPGQDVILANTATEIVQSLANVICNVKYYENMAAGCSLKVRKYHAPELVSKKFWDHAAP